MDLSEGSFAEVGQVIAGTMFVSFLTPDMASKNDARYGINPCTRKILCHFWCQKADKLNTCNQLPNFGKRGIIYEALVIT